MIYNYNYNEHNISYDIIYCYIETLSSFSISAFIFKQFLIHFNEIFYSDLTKHSFQFKRLGF